MSNRRIVICFVGALFSMLPVCVQAQTMLEPLQQQRLREARVTTVDPDVTAPYALPTPSVTLETVSGGGQAKANIGFARSQSMYRFSFRSPIGDAADAEANPLSLTGLGNNAAVEFAVTHLFLFKRYQDSDLLDFCRTNGVPPARCSDQAFGDEAKRRTFIDIALHRHPSMVAISGEVGAPAFEYLDPRTLVAVEDKLTSWKIAGSYSVLFAPDNLFAINFTQAHSYKASTDSTTICRPLTESDVMGATRCDDAVLGAPKAKDRSILTIEWRRQFVSSGGPMFGISARAHFDLKDIDKSSVEVPVYFLQKKPADDAGASLNGGVNAGWSSKDGFVAKVFVGAGFRLIER